jgi:rhodanese-related sulfurtransferase
MQKLNRFRFAKAVQRNALDKIQAKCVWLLGIWLLGVNQQAFSFDAANLTKKWQHTPFALYLDAQEAYDMKLANPDSVTLLDVRNRPEIHYIGMADAVDANIPYRFDSIEWKRKDESRFGTFQKPKNPNFALAVDKLLKARGLDKDSPIIIMCTSGSRAPFAAKALYKADFTQVYTQVEGFEGIKAETGDHIGKRVVNGWKNRGLPWRYDLPPEKMYFNFDPVLNLQ